MTVAVCAKCCEAITNEALMVVHSDAKFHALCFVAVQKERRSKTARERMRERIRAHDSEKAPHGHNGHNGHKRGRA